MTLRQALTRSLACAFAAAAFAGAVGAWRGGEAAKQFLAGYLVELSLSADNVFIFALIFDHFAVANGEQGRVLFWGIAGSAVLRGAFIFVGAGALHRFHWLIYVFGAFLIFTAIRVARPRRKERGGDPERNPAIRLMGRWIELAQCRAEGRFFVRQEGRWMPTRLFFVLISVELTDVLFAFDSVPAVLAITPSAVIAFTSNLFAVAGLRSLYFALTAMRTRVRRLETALVIILFFIGAKILISPWFVVGTGASLVAVGGVLAVAVLSSRRAARH